MKRGGERSRMRKRGKTINNRVEENASARAGRVGGGNGERGSSETLHITAKIHPILNPRCGDYIHVLNMYIHVCIYMYIQFKYKYLCIYLYIYAYMYMYKYIYVYKYMYIYVHIHMDTYK